MAGVALVNPKIPFYDALGAPLVGGTLDVYLAGTTTRTNTWQDKAQTTLNTNPIVLDSRGECTLWADDSLTYKFVLKNSAGVQQWSEDNISGATVSATLVNFTQAGTGAVTRTAQSKMRDIISVKDFGATGDGVTNDAAAIQAAITAANALGGAMVYLPEGTYYTGTTTINMAKWVTLQGSGKLGTVITYAGTGDAVKMTSAINSSTAVHTAVRDLGITCTNASNTGACYDDIGGTFVELENLALTGGKFGVIFDQTELATIRLCDIEAQLAGGAGIWLVNGADHTVGASSQFTNRILITENQFNNGAVAHSHIIDDGGVSHVICNNNFNSGIITATPPVCRFCGVLQLSFHDNYMEGGQTMLAFESATFYGAVGAGSSISVTISANIISMSQPNTPITQAAAASPLILSGNWFGGGSTYKLTGASLNTTIVADGNLVASGTLLDSDSAVLSQTDNTGVTQLGGLKMLVNKPTGGGIGYAAGAGGSVVQATSKSTQVTLNKMSGFIQTTADSLAANTTVSFQLNNSNIASADAIIVHRNFGGTASAYQVWVDSVGPGSCVICIRNTTAGALAEAVYLTFSIIKGAST